MKVSEKQANRRREIAKAVSDVIRVSDIESITVDDICSAAGIAKGTFYHYFTSKDQLWNEICYPIDDFFDSLREDILSCEDFEEAIAQYAKNYAIYVTTTGMIMCHTVIQTIISNNNSHFVDRARSVNSVLAEILQRGQERKQVTESLSVEEMTDMLLLTCRGYILNCCSTHEMDDLEDKIVTHLGLLAHSFRA